MKAVVIGAGISGLAAAAVLAKTGWEVEVFEQAVQAGGRAGLWEKDGFRFDTGPSWYLMPEVFEHFFELLGERLTDHLDVRKLDPGYRIVSEGYAPFHIYGNLERDAATFEAIAPGAGESLCRYVAMAGRTYGLAKRHFLYNPFTGWQWAVQSEVLRNAPRLFGQVTRNLHGQVERFVSARPLQQVLEYPMVFLGASPWNAPAMYHLMSHVDFSQGVFYPMGGMYEVVRAVEQAGRSMGVRYHYGSPVQQIVVDNGRAQGVVVDGQRIGADLVVSGADLHFTETELLPAEARTYPPGWWRRRTAGPSALLMYLGIRGTLPELEHHNLFFIKDWEDNFRDIFETGRWPQRGSLYVSRPSKTDGSVAPDGHENVVVLVPLPPTREGQPDHDTLAAAERYLAQLEEMSGIADLRERIVVRRIVGPRDFEQALHSWRGTALGMAHTLWQSAFMRPSGRSRKVHNLLYVGGGVQPGIGLPMCLISAEIMYKHLVGDTSAGMVTKLERPAGGWHV